ncbi:MAG: hypothetical protein AVDCRST_MAG90-76 [uncultured Microvirga sp.]|uniref:Uncharacterized protein n=1 Tax=uncultured Microvirga sp. TaxID=412392 RepID=A0A6J4KGN9_9HYPH|nr:MAG: hypothetical protein AVDCRST_MAG90-76 [uncultured Microvirga sp.]
MPARRSAALKRMRAILRTNVLKTREKLLSRTGRSPGRSNRFEFTA